MTIKKLLTGILLLLALMWISGELLLRSDERNAAMQKATLGTTTSEVAGVSTTSRELLPPAEKIDQRAATTIPNTSPLSTSVAKPPLSTVTAIESKEMMSVTLVVDGKTFTYQLPKGSSVASLLTLAQASGEISYMGKEYSGLGMLITGINGKANNQDKNNLFWIYSVNGNKATKGVSAYMLSSGDVVSWSYEQNTY